MGRPSPQTHGVSQVKCLQLGTGRASFLACSLKVLSKVSSSVISIAGLSTQVSCRIIRLKHVDTFPLPRHRLDGHVCPGGFQTLKKFLTLVLQGTHLPKSSLVPMWILSPPPCRPSLWASPNYFWLHSRDPCRSDLVSPTRGLRRGGAQSKCKHNTYQ